MGVLAAADAFAPTLGLVRGGVFGGTFQGEGPSQGWWTCFVRLHRCNLHCGLDAAARRIRPGGCDTGESWHEAEFSAAQWAYEATVEEVLKELEGRMQPRLRHGAPGGVVVTGGEPLMQAPQLAHLLRGCRARGWRTELETNGTLSPARLGGPDSWPDQFNVSLKLAGGINQGADPQSKRFKPQAIRAFLATGRAVWKFVVADLDDLTEVDRLVNGQLVEGVELPAGAVWIMPEGTNTVQILAGLRELADPVRDRGYCLSSRLHILIWGDERGR